MHSATVDSVAQAVHIMPALSRISAAQSQCGMFFATPAAKAARTTWLASAGGVLGEKGVTAVSSPANIDACAGVCQCRSGMGGAGCKVQGTDDGEGPQGEVLSSW
ncbi:hypothetical protein AcV7_001506 [Taiwanofungus camphoratus]|nr:hypothetical protein AcV7_001506 [Antrodia cinnamomea]